MAYVPYSTVAKDSNPKTGAISGVSIYPLYQQHKTTKVIPRPILSLISFTFSGTGGSSSANPTTTWSISGGTPTTLTYVLYGDSSSSPTTVVTTQTLANSATSYTYTGTTTPNYYYKASVTATNAGGSSTITTSVLHNVFNPAALSAPLITWFKGDSGLTRTSWKNNGTNGGTATITGGTLTTVNGLSAISLTLTTGYVTYTQNFTGQPRGFFAVIKLGSSFSTGYADYPFGGDFGNGNYVIQLYASSSTAQSWNQYANNTTPSLVTSTFNANQTTTPAVFASFNSASSTSNNYVYYNTSPLTLTTNNLASSYATGSNTVYLGAEKNGGVIGSSTTIVYCEALCYDGEMSSTDITNVITYLKNKWGSLP